MCFLRSQFSIKARGIGSLFQAALFVVVLTVLLFLTTIARANDSTGRVATSGISFTKSEDIRMVEEFLEISTKMVRVKYLFRNESAQDIDTTVVFPMPPYGWNRGPGGDLNIPNDRAIADFTVSVNGHHVSTSNIVEATLKGRNITKRLREIGLSDAQIANHAGCRLDGDRHEVVVCDLTRRQHDILKKEFELEGLNPDSWWYPEWKVNNTIVWKQTFPAGQDVVVEHTYTPFVGYSYTVCEQPADRGEYIFDNAHIPISSKSEEVYVGNKRKNDEVCLSNSIRKAMENQVKALHAANGTKVSNIRNPEWLNDVDGPGWIYITEQDVAYILGTGRNWKGTIGKFILRVKKETPDQLVSLCFPGKPMRVDSTTYEFQQTNFVPQDKLLIYFYTVATKVTR